MNVQVGVHHGIFEHRRQNHELEKMNSIQDLSVSPEDDEDTVYHCGKENRHGNNFDLSLDFPDKIVDISNLVPLGERNMNAVNRRALQVIGEITKESKRMKSQEARHAKNNLERLYPPTVAVEQIQEPDPNIIFQNCRLNVSRAKREEAKQREFGDVQERRRESGPRQSHRGMRSRGLSSRQPSLDREVVRQSSFERRNTIIRNDSSRSQLSGGTTTSGDRKPLARSQESFRTLQRNTSTRQESFRTMQRDPSFRNMQRDSSFRRQPSRSNLLGADYRSGGSSSNLFRQESNRALGRRAMMDSAAQHRLQQHGDHYQGNSQYATERHQYDNSSFRGGGGEQQYRHNSSHQQHNAADMYQRNSFDQTRDAEYGRFDHQNRNSFDHHTDVMRSNYDIRPNDHMRGGERDFSSQHQQFPHMERSSSASGMGLQKPDPLEIEITPGVFAQLRGAEETTVAVEDGHIQHCDCICCSAQLMCIDDADFVLCPSCKVVSPITDERNRRGGGVGLGLRVPESSIRQRAMRHQQFDAARSYQSRQEFY